MKSLFLIKMMGTATSLTLILALGFFTLCSSYGVSKQAASPEHLSTARQRLQLERARFQAAFQTVTSLQDKGDLGGAQAGYEALLRDPDFRNYPQLHMSFAEMLEKAGKHEEAMAAVKPLIFGNSVERNGTLTTSSNFEAVDLYTRNVRVAEGNAGLKAFRDRIRDFALDGFSLRHYNQEGLTDDETMDYIRGQYAASRGDHAEALKQYEKILLHRPPSFEFYSTMMGALGVLHRQQEIIPLFEDWYRHSSPEMKTQMKKRLSLDFGRLEGEGLPWPRHLGSIDASRHSS